RINDEFPDERRNLAKWVDCENRVKAIVYQNKWHFYIRYLEKEINETYSNFSKTALEKLTQLKNGLKPKVSDSDIEKITCDKPKVNGESLIHLYTWIWKRQQKPASMKYFIWRGDVLSLVLEEMERSVIIGKVE
ncbi:hypothetical protein EWB00_000850, partial [Schistosoma japonicum]